MVYLLCLHSDIYFGIWAAVGRFDYCKANTVLKRLHSLGWRAMIALSRMFSGILFSAIWITEKKKKTVQPGQDKYSRWGFRAFLHLDQSCGSRDPTNRTVWSLSKSLIHISFQHYTNGTVCSNWQMLQKISDHISGAVDRVKAFFNYWLKLRKKYSIAWRSTVI